MPEFGTGDGTACDKNEQGSRVLYRVIHTHRHTGDGGGEREGTYIRRTQAQQRV